MLSQKKFANSHLSLPSFSKSDFKIITKDLIKASNLIALQTSFMGKVFTSRDLVVEVVIVVSDQRLLAERGTVVLTWDSSAVADDFSKPEWAFLDSGTEVSDKDRFKSSGEYNLDKVVIFKSYNTRVNII